MHTTDLLLKTAIGHHQAGELETAAGLYHQIIRVDPRHADALHLLGVAAHQRCDHQRAVELITQAIEIDATSPLYFCNLGAAYRELGELDNAIDCFSEAVRMAPDFAGAHYNLGMSLDACGDVEGAVSAYGTAIRLDPQYGEAHNNLGRLYSSISRWNEAIEAYRTAIAANPALAEAHYNLGNALLEIGDAEQAVACFRTAITLIPHVAEVHNNLGTAYKQLDRYEQAGECFRTAVKLAPDNAAVHNNLGSVLQFQDRLEPAFEAFQRAVRLQPDFAGAHTNLGNVYNEWGDLPVAIACYDRAISLEPVSAEAGFNRALALLRAGQFAEGWEEYEWRWKRKVTRRRCTVPEWDGSDPRGRTLLIWAEQGIGDEVMFASCLADVLKAPGRFVIECDPRLVPLFARSFASATVVARNCADADSANCEADATARSGSPKSGTTRRSAGTGNSLPAAEDRSAGGSPGIDLHVALGSLPRVLGLELESFPRSRCYLQADPQLRNRWRSRYDGLGPGLKVGMAWQGGLEPDVARKRSTRLERWTSLLATDGVHFVNVQHGACRSELSSPSTRTHRPIHDWPGVDPVRDLDDFSAQLAELDLVISVDNSTVHLAGALGVPVWTLLPVASDWRWMLDRTDSYWYPSVRLFRQTSSGDWESVFTAVESALKELVRRGPQCGQAQAAHK